MSQILNLAGLGWKVKVQEKKRNYLLTLAKELVLGNLIKKGDELYYYLGDINGRKAIITLLDSKPLENSEKIMIKE